MTTSFGSMDGVPTGNLLEDGQYQIRLLDVKLHENNKKNGQYVSCQFGVSDGKGTGFTFFQNFNLINPNAQAREMALRAIKQMLMAFGHNGSGELSLELIESFKGHELLADIGTEKSKDPQYDDSNKVKRYKALHAGQQSTAPLQQQPPQQQYQQQYQPPPQQTQQYQPPPPAPQQPVPTTTAPPTQAAPSDQAPWKK